MNFLLDTNVVSEPVTRQPNRAVLAWIGRQDPLALYLSVATCAEIEAGIATLPSSRRRSRLDQWRDQLVASFEDRILLIDLEVARSWASIRARSAREGAPIGPMDAFIAATAEARGLTLITRNVRDFEAWGGPIFNPWTAD